MRLAACKLDSFNSLIFVIMKEFVSLGLECAFVDTVCLTARQAARGLRQLGGGWLGRRHGDRRCVARQDTLGDRYQDKGWETEGGAMIWNRSLYC